jgi:hypothetical protein
LTTLAVKFLDKFIGSLLAYGVVVENKERVQLFIVETPDPTSTLVATLFFVAESFCFGNRGSNIDFTFVLVWVSRIMVLIVAVPVSLIMIVSILFVLRFDTKKMVTKKPKLTVSQMSKC